jgi:hypothetical protein
MHVEKISHNGLRTGSAIVPSRQAFAMWRSDIASGKVVGPRGELVKVILDRYEVESELVLKLLTAAALLTLFALPNLRRRRRGARRSLPAVINIQRQKEEI